ncbi:MAG TPA: tRNA (adenosine(37)-N6)-threonylcarbamoyltransferase complex ATPase subunit type 1 TsaE [Candidatus Magasanikbacteria bacterium]|nr:tRNA (adenosine(37)-N6)-threonylcarbamoyltransferase complex ATPase subunit type 1 TsaE [Candidatus Magasanikbacteria bacterium]
MKQMKKKNIVYYNTDSPEKTRSLGEEVAATLCGGDILLLFGDLGAGKTTFVQGLAKKLGVSTDVVSPTFTLCAVYPTKTKKIKQLVHIDTYRIHGPNELRDIGVEEYLGSPDTICVVEWPEKIESLLTKNMHTKKVMFSHEAPRKRHITIEEIA